MDPLAVFRGFGKLLDAVLPDRKPICGRDLAPYETFEGVKIFSNQRGHESLLLHSVKNGGAIPGPYRGYL